MRWLITTSADTNLEELEQRLGTLGIRFDRETPPVPLGEDEQVVGVVAPADVNHRLADDEAVLGVYPDSEYELYDATPATPQNAGSKESEAPHGS